MLPFQGPPGAGKTYLGARMILSAVAAGKKVGVVAPSNDGELCARAEKAKDADAILAAFAGGAQIAAGSAWLWARKDMRGVVDVLFIDEGGQFSLAKAAGSSRRATCSIKPSSVGTRWQGRD
ncbi:MAG: hypothetical protein ACT443_09715 [Gemmatimonadota bacterium]